jgi:cell division protein FtsL
MYYEGTSALTLNPPITAPQRRPVPRPAYPAAAEQPKVAAPAKRIEKNPYMQVSFFTVFLFVAAIAALMFVVYKHMELSQLNDAGRRGAAELTALKREENDLNRRVEAGVSLSEVEAYAVGELGMVKPTGDRIVYIAIPAYDHAEIVQQTGFFGNVRQLFSTMTGHIVAFFD